MDTNAHVVMPGLTFTNPAAIGSLSLNGVVITNWPSGGGGGGTLLWTTSCGGMFPNGTTGTNNGWIATATQIYPQ